MILIYFVYYGSINVIIRTCVYIVFVVQFEKFIECTLKRFFNYWSRGGVAQWVARLTRNVEVVDSRPIKVPRCFLEQ